MINYNKLYNARSTSSLIFIGAKCTTFFTDEERADKNFEVVYAVLEDFTSGHVHKKVCYRLSNPARAIGKKVSGEPETLTFTKRIIYEPDGTSQGLTLN